MKKICSCFLIFAILISNLTVLAACGGFKGGISTFFKQNTFYKDVGNVVASVIGGSNAYIPLIDNDSILAFDLSSKINKYKYHDQEIGDGNEAFNATLLVTPEFNMDVTTALNAFDQNATMRAVIENDSFLLDLGAFEEKPFYFKGDGNDSLLQKTTKELKKRFEAGEYVNKEEVYKFHGKNIEANTIEVCLNSDETFNIIDYIYDLFVNTNNLIFNSKTMDVLNFSYIIQGEKLHLTWKRYFNDKKLCRESFKIHDNNGHYIIIDTSYLKNKKTEWVDITVSAFDGNGTFNIFSVCAKRVNSKNGFETIADAIIGDYLKISAANTGSNTNSEGTADVYFMDTVGEVKLPIAFSYSKDNAEATSGLDSIQSFKLKTTTENIFLEFDIEFSLKVHLSDATLSATLSGEYYDVSDRENMYYYNNAIERHNKEYSDVITILKGDIPEEDAKPIEPEVDPYVLDIYYDYSTKFETDGTYGERYVNLLQSDNFTYSYTYHAREEGYPLNKCTKYCENGETMYLYNYEDGTEYAQLFSGTTRYEVRHDLQKILYTEYTKEDFETYYPEQVYIFYESGFCNYNSRELVYEKYYDYSNNKYIFIFDENKELEIMVVESSSGEPALYTFIEELSDQVPDGAMKMPSYPYVSVLDHFQ